MIIRYSLFRLDLELVDGIYLPDYKGSTFRGAFGTQFKRIVCALKKKDCGDCILKDRCVYSYIFETPVPEGCNIFGRVRSAPHPFIIEPPEEGKNRYSKGESLSFNFILIGRAIDYLPYFIYTFDELGSNGIGKGRGGYCLRKIYAISVADGDKLIYSSDSKKIFPSRPDRIDLSDAATAIINNDSPFLDNSHVKKLTLHFRTPARIKYNGRLTIDLEFHILIRQVLRRLFLLNYFHDTDSSSPGVNNPVGYHRQLIKMSEGVRISESSLRWYDWERYSKRQDTRMKLGGFTGRITYGEAPDVFLPFIKAGEILHIGKGTSFGLGRYRILKDI